MDNRTYGLFGCNDGLTTHSKPNHPVGTFVDSNHIFCIIDHRNNPIRNGSRLLGAFVADAEKRNNPNEIRNGGQNLTTNALPIYHGGIHTFNNGS